MTHLKKRYRMDYQFLVSVDVFRKTSSVMNLFVDLNLVRENRPGSSTNYVIMILAEKFRFKKLKKS